MNKITFNDKENSVITNSLYILNADNINEIKYVINNIIDEFERTDFKFYNIFKFVNISIPNFYIENDYEIVLEFSFLETFGVYKSISSITNKNQFYIFDNGKYINFKDLNNKSLVNKNDLEKTILVDVSEIQYFRTIGQDKNVKYFGRYYFKLNNEISSNYFGLVQGNSEFTFKKINYGNVITTLSNTYPNNLNSSNIQNFERINYFINNDDQIELHTYIINDKKSIFNNVIEVTNLTEYFIENNNIEKISNNTFKIKENVENEIFKFSCITNYKFVTYYSNVNVMSLKEKEYKNIDLKFIINKNDNNNLIFNSLEEINFDIEFSYVNFNEKHLIKYSENPNNFNISFNDSLFNINNNLINVHESYLDNISKIVVEYQYDDESFIKEFPITIKGSSSNYKIYGEFSSSTFSEKTPNNQYAIYLEDQNGNKKDVTLNTNIILLNDQTVILNDNIYNNLEFIKSLKIFNVSDINKIFNLDVMFQYFDDETEKTFNFIKTFSLSNSNSFSFINFIVNVPQNIELNETENYSISSMIKNDLTNEIIENDITSSCEIIADNCLSFNNGNISFKDECSCNLIDQKQFLVTIKYNFNNNIFEKNIVLNVHRKRILNIYIEGDDELKCAETSTIYNVFATYEDGTIKDISNDQNLHLYLGNDNIAILNDRRITTSILRDHYNIILNAEYIENGCDNLIHKTSKIIHVLKYGLYYTTLSGESSLFSNKSNNYYTNAHYANGNVHEYVQATYTITDINGNPFTNDVPVVSSYNDETNVLTIHAKKRLNDINFMLSSYYEEPGYEEFENSLISKNIKIIGGFNVKLHGTLLTYDEENDNIKYTNFESPSSVYIKDFTSTDDELIKANNWEPLEIEKSFTNETNISPISFIKTNNYYLTKIYKKDSLDQWSYIDTIKTTSVFTFISGTYKLIYDTVSNTEEAKFSCNLFELDFNFDNSYILGLSGLYFEDGFQIMNPIAVFVTNNNYKFTQKFIYDKDNDIWFLNNIPSMATKINEITVNYAFTEKEI